MNDLILICSTLTMRGFFSCKFVKLLQPFHLYVLYRVGETRYILAIDKYLYRAKANLML